MALRPLLTPQRIRGKLDAEWEARVLQPATETTWQHIEQSVTYDRIQKELEHTRGEWCRIVVLNENRWSHTSKDDDVCRAVQARTAQMIRDRVPLIVDESVYKCDYLVRHGTLALLIEERPNTVE